MHESNKATRIELRRFKTRPMRAFDRSGFAFCLRFFAWFGIAPLMKVVREELDMTREQIGNCIIASVSNTSLARLPYGWLCGRLGARRSYAWLLVLGTVSGTVGAGGTAGAVGTGFPFKRGLERLLPESA